MSQCEEQIHPIVEVNVRADGGECDCISTKTMKGHRDLKNRKI